MTPNHTSMMAPVVAPRPRLAADCIVAGSLTRLSLAGLAALGVSTVSAQALLTTPMPYEQCVARQRQLREEARQAGDRAWSIVKSLPGVQFVSRESNEWYRRAKELHDMADRMKCIWRPNRDDKSDKSAKKNAVLSMLR
jgi:hypothetical protein